MPNKSNSEKATNSLEKQACVKAIRKAILPKDLRKEMESFISRNVLPDCGRVPPNCLKAHLVKKAKEIGLGVKKVNSIKKLFKAKIGYEGYYLDAGKLRKV